jgi:uncharacterized repeat protein (TIGR03803 family)
MKRNIPLAVRSLIALPFFVALLASSAYAGSAQPVVAYTFTCNGLHRLGACPDGGRPDSLILGSDGNFYGTAQVSIEGSSESLGGVVFSLTPAGKLTVLHTFGPGASKNYANGNLPGGLTEGPDGRLYGYTEFGGFDGCDGYCGDGVLYRVNRNGSGFKVIEEFCSDGSCGDIRPVSSPMVAGTDGNLYGTIDGSGSAYGSIFRITPSTGAYETIFNFDFSSGEGYPSGLTAAPNGSFYGMALGSIPALLFNYTPVTGNLTTVSVNFPVIGLDPSSPVSSLIFGPNGNLYGLYEIYDVRGLGLFEVAPDGSNLQEFPFFNTVAGGGGPDGLMLASDGNFWMADYSGSDGSGDIISLSPTDGTLLQTFTPFSSAAAVGAYPEALVQAKDGTLWGSTYQFGDASKGHFADGTVFTLNAGLPPR